MARDTINPPKKKDKDLLRDVRYNFDYIDLLREKLRFAEFMKGEGFAPDPKMMEYDNPNCPLQSKYNYQDCQLRIIVRRIPVFITSSKYSYMNDISFDKRVELFIEEQKFAGILKPRVEKIEELIRIFKTENKGVSKSIFRTNGIIYYIEEKNNSRSQIWFNSSRRDDSSYQKGCLIYIRITDNDMYLEESSGLEKFVRSEKVFGKKAAMELETKEDKPNNKLNFITATPMILSSKSLVAEEYVKNENNEGNNSEDTSDELESETEQGIEPEDCDDF